MGYRSIVISSGVKLMVFFDLPAKTKAQRRVATGFRNFLLKDGYHILVGKLKESEEASADEQLSFF